MDRNRINVGSGARWEPIVGYSRAVRVGDHVFVAGTTAAGPDGTLHGAADAYAQACEILSRIAAALGRAGATMRDVVRTRIYVTDIARWQDIGRAHGEFFGSIRPACTMVEVARLIDPELRVEIEADAIVAPGDGH